MTKIKPQRVNEIKAMLCSCRDCDESNLYFEELQKLKFFFHDNENLNVLARFTGALASNERLIILNILKEKDRCVCELETVLDKSQSTISHHIRKLVSAGLIEGYKKGNFTYYHLIKDEIVLYLDKINEFFR